MSASEFFIIYSPDAAAPRLAPGISLAPKMTTETECANCKAQMGAGSRVCSACGAPSSAAGFIYPSSGNDLYFVGRDGYFFGEAIPMSWGRAGNAVPVARLLTAVRGDNVLRRMPPSVMAAASVLAMVTLVLLALSFWRPSMTASTLDSEIAAGKATSGIAREIRDAMDAANGAQSQALRTVTISPLDGKMTGRWLATNKQIVRQLQLNGHYEVVENLQLDYGAVTLMDESHAIAHTTERWRSTVFNSDGASLVGSTAPDLLSEVYTLVRVHDSWLVEQVDIKRVTDPSPTP